MSTRKDEEVLCLLLLVLLIHHRQLKDDNMKLKYKLGMDEYLEYHLYKASKSDNISKKKNRGWVFLTLASILLVVFFYLNSNVAMSIYFAVVALIVGFFYPKYFKWRYKKHYEKFIAESYANKIDAYCDLELKESEIIMIDETGQSSIKVDSISHVENLENIILINISNGVSIVIPKSFLENYRVFIDKLNVYGKEISHDEGWKW